MQKMPAAKRKIPSPSIRSQLYPFFQILIFFSIIACIITLLKLQTSPPLVLVQPEEEEIFTGNPKVAFLFLARTNLPLDFVWNSFFEGADDDELFSIYVHSKPGFVFDEKSTRSRFFLGRHIQNSIQVGWGEASMIEAERLLLEKALMDPANQRFVLLSDSCVPLYNFSYTYTYLISSSKSFVDSFLDKIEDKKEDRYNPKMSPAIPKDKWRKGSQWITLIRKHARVVVGDNIIFPIFKRHCKRRPDLHLEGKHNMKKQIVQKEHNCIPDEHYIPTLLSMSELDGELERRTLTYTSWNQSSTEKGKQAWHPKTFHFKTASPWHIKQIKDMNHVYYESESRMEWCKSNSTLVPCFLFVRKFSRSAAMRLLTEGRIGPFDPASLLFPASI